MHYLLILFIVFLNCGGLFFNRKFARDTQQIPHSYEIYTLLLYPLATVYYFLLAKGNVPLNWPTLLFSIVFAVICLGSNLFNIRALRSVNVVHITIFEGAGATILPFLFEAIVLRESFSVFTVLAVILRLIAVSIPLLFSKQKKESSAGGIFICVMLFVIAGSANIITKLYGDHPNVYSDSSFCFWTNVCILPIVLFRALRSTSFQTLKAQCRKIPKKDYLYIILTMALSNLATLLVIEAVRQTGATLYSVLSASSQIVAYTLLSVFAYKEKLTKETLLGVIFSILAIVVGVL